MLDLDPEHAPNVDAFKTLAYVRDDRGHVRAPGHG